MPRRLKSGSVVLSNSAPGEAMGGCSFWPTEQLSGATPGNWRVIEWADALRPTSELALESAGQGDAFLKTVRAAWPHSGLDRAPRSCAGDRTQTRIWRRRRRGLRISRCGPGASTRGFPACCRRQSDFRCCPQHPLGPDRWAAGDGGIGTGHCSRLYRTCSRSRFDDIGAATPMVDWASMQHETQYTRLFRS